MPSIVSSFARATPIASSVSNSSCSPCSASWRRAPSSEAISSEDGLVERSSRSARATASGSIAAAVADVQHRALRQRAGDLVRAREHRVGALRQRGRRQLVVEAEVRAPRLVDDERDAGAVGDLGAAGDVGGHPVVGRRDDERRARVGAAASAASSAAGVTQCVMPELRVVLGRDEARDAAAEHEPVDDRRVRVALGDDPRAQRRQRQAQRVVALGGAVGEEERARGAERLGGELLGALVGRRRRAEVDRRGCPAGCRRRARRRRSPCAAPGRRPGRPCGRGRGSAPGRGTRRRRRRRGRARSAARGPASAAILRRPRARRWRTGW